MRGVRCGFWLGSSVPARARIASVDSKKYLSSSQEVQVSALGKVLGKSFS
jgi:hypothetical protein